MLDNMAERNSRNLEDSRPEQASLPPVPPRCELERTPSMHEKEVVVAPLPGSKFSETDLCTPVTPFTDYDECPYAFPQALGTEPKYLQYERDPAEEAPETKVELSPPYAHTSEEAESQPNSSMGELSSQKPKREDDGEGRICGLSRLWFGVVLGIFMAVLIAAGVGGGIGGALASRNNSGKQNTVAPATTSYTTTSTTSISSAPSSSPSIDPNAPSRPIITGWNFTAYSLKNFTGYTRTFSTEGLYHVSFPAANPLMQPNPFGDPNNATTATFNSTIANSYVWIPTDSGCCVRFCKNNTSLGFRCVTQTLQPDSTIDKVILACGAQPSEDACAGQG